MRRLVLLAAGVGRSRFSQRLQEKGFDVILCEEMPVEVLSDLRTTYDHITFIGHFDKSLYGQDIDSYILFSTKDINLPSHIPVLSVPGRWRWLLFSERVFLEVWGWLTYKVFDEVGFDEPMGYESKLILNKDKIFYESAAHE